MQIQEKFHLSEEKVMKLLKHAGGKPKLQEDRLLAGDFDPNQVSLSC
jgi:striatin 1/3/4